MPNESGLDAIARQAEQMKAEQLQLKRTAEEGQASVVKEAADIAEGNLTSFTRIYAAHR